MTSGLDNLSLALFTALAPAGVVAFIIMALAHRRASLRSWHSRSCGSGRATARPQCASTA